MIESVGDQWGDYLRLSRRMSEHTIDAYLGDLRALLDYVGLRWDAPAGEFGQALTQRSIRSWLAHTLASGGARSTVRVRGGPVPTASSVLIDAIICPHTGWAPVGVCVCGW